MTLLSLRILAPLSILLSIGSAMGATPKEIDDAIEKGKQYLYKIQLADGTWENINKQPGLTNVCVYALLTAGESPRDPRLAKAVDFVVKEDDPGTYIAAFRALALSKLEPTPDVKAALNRVFAHLLNGAGRPKAPGLYGYKTGDAYPYWDHSNSQYGLLGVWACAEAGVEVPDKYWSLVDKSWRDTVEPDGSWSYTATDKRPDNASMTPAGIATLFITDDMIARRSAGACNGNVVDKTIENGINWMLPHLAGRHDLYELYGIERIGMASGYKSIGDYDWFKEGADQIVHNQQPDGSWPDWGPPVGTSYALLFLSRGRAPVVMNKLRYDADPNAATPVDGHWNQRPRDAAGATAFIGGQLESFMNWQVVTLHDDPDDLHDSPILYIAGNQPLIFTHDQEQKLRNYAEGGGIIVANADCAANEFSTSFTKLCKRLFDNKYEFRVLPADHQILSHEQFLASKWKNQPLIEGMSNGVRELAILIPSTDPAKAWTRQQARTQSEAFELIADIYLYSVDRKNISRKGESYVVKPDAATAASTIKLARLKYDGNWDPEPGGWRRMAAIVHNQLKINLDIASMEPGYGKLQECRIAHLTGTTSFQLDDLGRSDIQKFVANGGTLIVDAAGGSQPFADAAERELEAIFPKEAVQLQYTVAAPSPFFGEMNSADFVYRAFVRNKGDTVRGSRIRIIKFNGRPGVIFSREDMSAGLVGEDVDGINGYTPAVATRLMAGFIKLASEASPATQSSR